MVPIQKQLDYLRGKKWDMTVYYFDLNTSQTRIQKCNNQMSTWFRRVLRVIEDKYVTRGCLGGDDTGVLGHVARPVHFPLMIDLDLYLDLATHRPKSSKLYDQSTHLN